MNDLPPSSVAEADDDDRPVGHFLTRREVLALFGAGGVAVVAAACAPGGAGTPAATSGASGTVATTAPSGTSGAVIPSCVVVPELTEGPYYVDSDLDRSDIRPDTTTGEAAAGVPLTLTWLVSTIDGSSCVPLAGAVVDLWHCDALGEYSGVQGDTGNFVRGIQHTDADGKAVFTTIYPGWYQGRAVHAHFKVRTEPDASEGYELTSQLFFDDELSREIYSTTEPYTQKGAQDQRNESDGIFQQSDGTTLLDVRRSGDGYAATFAIALQSA